MAHITTDSNGDPSPNAGAKGPLLVIHDQDTDGTSFLENYDQFEPSLVSQFFDLGWDLYIANMRGTKPSRKHNTFDPDGSGANGAADYWNFDVSTQAEFDVPAMINAIQQKRADDGKDCLKVHIYDSASTSLLTSALFPTTSRE